MFVIAGGITEFHQDGMVIARTYIRGAVGWCFVFEITAVTLASITLYRFAKPRGPQYPYPPQGPRPAQPPGISALRPALHTALTAGSAPGRAGRNDQPGN